MPEDASLSPAELKDAFEQTDRVTVYLALPNLHLGRPNAQGPDGGDQARFGVDTHELEDENSGINPQPVPAANKRQVTLNTGSRVAVATPAGTGSCP